MVRASLQRDESEGAEYGHRTQLVLVDTLAELAAIALAETRGGAAGGENAGVAFSSRDAGGATEYEGRLDGQSSAGAEGPVLVGALATTIPLADPELEPGVYLVEWHPGESFQGGRFVFRMLEGEKAGEIGAPPVLYDRMREGRVVLAEDTPHDRLMLSFCVPGRQRSKGFLFYLPLAVEPGLIDRSWR